MTRARLARARSRTRSRGAVFVEYLVLIGALGLIVATALVLIAGPTLFRSFRVTQRAAAAPMP